MSIKVTSAVWEHSPQSASVLLILLALADHADDSGYCWPSVQGLAKKARTGDRNVQFILEQLEIAGEIVREINAGPATRTGKLNRYRVLAGSNLYAPKVAEPRKKAIANPAKQVTSESGGVNTDTSLDAEEMNCDSPLETPEEVNADSPLNRGEGMNAGSPRGERWIQEGVNQSSPRIIREPSGESSAAATCAPTREEVPSSAAAASLPTVSETDGAVNDEVFAGQIIPRGIIAAGYPDQGDRAARPLPAVPSGDGSPSSPSSQSEPERASLLALSAGHLAMRRERAPGPLVLDFRQEFATWTNPDGVPYADLLRAKAATATRAREPLLACCIVEDWLPEIRAGLAHPHGQAPHTASKDSSESAARAAAILDTTPPPNASLDVMVALRRADRERKAAALTATISAPEGAH